MSSYFAPEESIFFKLGHKPEQTIATIANRYIGSNPSNGFTFRSFHQESFKQVEDGRYDINLQAKFPESPLGSYGYAFAGIYCEADCDIELSLSCYGPVRIYLHSSLLYKSTMDDDVNIRRRKTIQASLRKGWNPFFIKLLKTASGFGCQFGSANGKWFPLHFLAPFTGRSGMGGWIYSTPVSIDVFPEEGSLPSFDTDEATIQTLEQVSWLPVVPSTTLTEHGVHELHTLFQGESGNVAYAWSSFQVSNLGETPHNFHVASASKLRVWVDNTLAAEIDSSSTSFQLSLPNGRHNLLVECMRGLNSWHFDVEISHAGKVVPFLIPAHVQGTATRWLYLGPFSERLQTPERIRTLHQLFTTPAGALSSHASSQYWRTGDKDIFVRPYLENELHAKWNYPLGVTLYGLLQAGRALNRCDIVSYVVDHIQTCTDLYTYSLWDKERYGSPAINHQLVELNMLDDCGSFGSAMLEVNREADHATMREIAHIVAAYIQHGHERKSDGAFYRQRTGEYQENTLWADDLYMSTPFLCRYYQLTGDLTYITDAAKQFLLFKKYLFIPEHKIMAHVYDFKYETSTYIPWGRGNGWVLFSLSELLAVLPESHELRDELIDFFRTLAAGYAKLQGTNGLWHQVLTDRTSYEETSCTAMFTYAFCRGIRYGWLDQPAPYKEAVQRAWEGLTKLAIDQSGNVYGVCRGSGYSFTPLYYKDELNWILNDTHGIGIILLCGIEYMKLQGN